MNIRRRRVIESNDIGKSYTIEKKTNNWQPAKCKSLTYLSSSHIGCFYSSQRVSILKNFASRPSPSWPTISKQLATPKISDFDYLLLLPICSNSKLYCWRYESPFVILPFSATDTVALLQSSDETHNDYEPTAVVKCR